MVRDEQTARRALQEENERHDRLVALGLWGVRWTTREIRDDAAAVSRRLMIQSRAARPERFTGLSTGLLDGA